MKKLIMIVLGLVLMNCSDDQIVDNLLDDNKLVSVAGQILEKESNAVLSNIIIELLGAESFKDTSDLNGKYLFSDVPKGSYILSIKDTSFKVVDLTIIIDSDTTVTCILENKNLVNISGVIIDVSTNNMLSNIIVELKGKNTYKDTSNINGSFIFPNMIKQNYTITINDSSFQKLDSTLVINSDTTIDLFLTPLVLSDYFPLDLGNFWTYSYEYYWAACFMYDDWETGTLTWEIIEVKETQDSTQYIVEETVNGLLIKWPPMGDIDTTFVNQTNQIIFTYKDDDFIFLSNENYLKNMLDVEAIKRNHLNITNTLIFDSYYTFFNVDLGGDPNIKNDYYTGDLIEMTEGIGITDWKIRNLSNCSPKGSLVLKDFHIEQ